MLARSYNSGDYRFGYQKQEKDGEWNDNYAFEYRINDPRLGKFFSVDPLYSKYAYNSPYAFAENRVIDGIDLEGLEFLPVNNANIPAGGATANSSGGTDLDLGGGVSFSNVSTVSVGGSQYYDLGQHVYYGPTGWSTSGSRSEQQTELSKVGMQLISNIDALPNTPPGYSSPNWSTTDPKEIKQSQEQALQYNNCEGVCYATTESRANQAYKDQAGNKTNVVNLTVNNSNVDHRIASTQGGADPFMGYGAGGPFARRGLGQTVDNTEVWSGSLQTGALLQRWNSTDVANLYGRGGHSVIFRNYVYDASGNITALEITDYHGGVRNWDRSFYETTHTILGVNLLDK